MYKWEVQNWLQKKLAGFFQSSEQRLNEDIFFHFSNLIGKLHFVLNTEIKYDFFKIRILLVCILINLSVLLPKHQSCVEVSRHMFY